MELEFITGNSDELAISCEYEADYEVISDYYSTGDPLNKGLIIKEITVSEIRINGKKIKKVASWLYEELIDKIVKGIEEEQE